MRQLLSILLLFTSISLQAVELETNLMTDIFQRATELGRTYNPKEVLIVFDIDNTLLATKQNIGSDQWYNWQKSLIKLNDPNAAVSTIEELHRTMGTLFYLSRMTPVESYTPLITSVLAGRGFKVMALTARPTYMRDATEREFKRNYYNFEYSTIGPQKGFPGKFKIKGLKELVSFQNGIAMAHGQHKGKVLENIIKKSDANIKAIIFIDDHKHNVTNVNDSFESTDIEIYSYRYGGHDRVVEKFKKSDKSKIIQTWNKLKQINDSIFK